MVLAAEALLSQCPVELKDVVNPQDAGPEPQSWVKSTIGYNVIIHDITKQRT
jgi:hypothetical protein